MIPFLWIANPFVFIAWFLNSKAGKSCAGVALTLSALAAIIAVATLVLFSESPQIGHIVWVGSIALTLVGSIRNFSRIADIANKRALGLNR